MKYLIDLLPVFLSVALFSSTAYSEEIKLSTPKIEKTYQEQNYYFSIQEYTPPLTSKNDNFRKLANDSPEKLLTKLVEAMKTGNYSAYLSLWDKESVIYMKNLDKERGETEADIVSYWSKVINGKNAVITHKLTTGEYIILAYKLKDISGDESKTMQSNVPMKRVDGKWYLTQDLRKDPVLSNWRTPTRKLPVIVRDINWNIIRDDSK